MKSLQSNKSPRSLQPPPACPLKWATQEATQQGEGVVVANDGSKVQWGHGMGNEFKGREGTGGTQVQSTLLFLPHLPLISNTTVFGVFLTMGHKQTPDEAGCSVQTPWGS